MIMLIFLIKITLSNNDEINPSDLSKEEVEVDIEEKLDEKIEVITKKN